MPELPENFRITSSRCKVCMSPLRDRIDLMLMHEERRDDGSPYRYADIVDFAAAHGLTLSDTSLGRHRSDHLQPSVMATLEAQRAMDALSTATGRKLSLHSAVANVIATKALRLLDDADLSAVSIDKVLRVAMRAAEVSLKIEKAEVSLSVEKVREVDAKLTEQAREKNLDPEVLRAIRRDLYGLVDAEPEETAP